MLFWGRRRDGANREGGAALRLAAAAAECQGGDLGHLPGELAPDAAHVPAVRAGHPHPPGRDPGQQGALPQTAEHCMISESLTLICPLPGSVWSCCCQVRDMNGMLDCAMIYNEPKGSYSGCEGICSIVVRVATALQYAGTGAEQQCGGSAGGRQGHE